MASAGQERASTTPGFGVSDANVGLPSEAAIDMKLASIIADLRNTDDALCIVAKRPWTHDSDARLISLTEQYRVPAEVLAET